MQVIVVAQSRQNREPDKPNEDAYAARLAPRRAILVVADGVTRSRTPDGAYPSPSGATIAAGLVAQTLASALAAPDGEPELRRAFVLANRAVDGANRRHGVWDRLDYGAHDLWGAVATVAVLWEDRLYWGHLGDSVLLHLPRRGGLTVCTPDQVAAAAHRLRQESPETLDAAGGRERFVRLHLRNRPEVAGSYGVLTGEGPAESYVVTGQLALEPGDRLALLSDGFVSLYSEGDAALAPLQTWLRAPLEQEPLRALIAAAEEADERAQARSDDKTVVLALVSSSSPPLEQRPSG